jgi:probable phosphoglycerate mutase
MVITQIFFIRHGQTDWNQERRIQGQTDIPLNAEGLEQAERLCHFVRQSSSELDQLTQCSVIYSSPLQRTVNTAAPLANFLNKPITPLEALQERHFGSIQGMTYPELEAQMPVESRMINERDPEFRPSGGESLIDLRARVRGLLGSLLKNHAGETVICFTHGGVLDIIYREATHTLMEAKRTWGIPNAGVNHLVHRLGGEPPWRVQAWAFVRHLQGPQASTNADF